MFLAIVTVNTSACSTRGMYEYVAGATAVDCTKYSNADERARCKKETDVSYEQYERERQKSQGK
jgi:hypothetical protein